MATFRTLTGTEDYERILDKIVARTIAPALRDALDALTESEQQAIHLVKLRRLDYVEAARAMGCSVAAARVRTHRAVKRLRRKLVGNLLWLALLQYGTYPATQIQKVSELDLS